MATGDPLFPQFTPHAKQNGDSYQLTKNSLTSYQTTHVSNAMDENVKVHLQTLESESKIRQETIHNRTRKLSD